MMQKQRLYYRIVCFGMTDGAVQDSPTAAWASWERLARRQGYEEHQMGEVQAIHSARMVVATTRRAAEDADVSESGGEVGKGRWWVAADAGDEDDEDY